MRLELLQNGILVATYRRRTQVTLEAAREIVSMRLDFAGLDPRPVLIYNQGVVHFDKQARRYVSSGDGILGIKAAAVIDNHPFTHLIMSYIVSVERPAIPARTFINPERAMRWLLTFL